MNLAQQTSSEQDENNHPMADPSRSQLILAQNKDLPPVSVQNTVCPLLCDCI